MKTLSLPFCAVLALSLLSAGCVSKKVYLNEMDRGNQLAVKSDSLSKQVVTLQDQIRALETTLQDQKTSNSELLKTLDAKKGELNQRLAELTKQNQDFNDQLQSLEREKEAEIAKLKGSYDELVNGLKSELQAGQVTITQLKGRLSVNMVDKILFNSGEAELKPEGRIVIDTVGEVLKKMTDKDIRIEGYTDNVPISAALRGRYATNWELSTARSTAVVRYLQDHAGIPADRLIAAGYGETHPIAVNTTPEGRQQNRRIEIVLVPVETDRTPNPDRPAAATP